MEKRERTNRPQSHRRRTEIVLPAVVLALAIVVASCVPGVPVLAAAQDAAWLSPVPGLQIVRGFDKPEHDWNAGHRGIDIAARPGEPVRAPAAGAITFAGRVAESAVVSIDVGAYTVSFTGVTASVAKGDRVSTGDTIGTVAAAGHCADGCIHVGAWPTGTARDYTDPSRFFGSDASVLLRMADAPDELPAGAGDATTSGAGAWGGHANGRIPEVALCSLKTAPGHRQRCDAATAFDAMSAAYRQRFGTYIPVTDSYRDYQTQVILKARKGRMAATPGRSNHGWGLAVDLGGGISSFGTTQHEWMRANAPRFGWIHPGWARQSGSLPEPWHWEFRAG